MRFIYIGVPTLLLLANLILLKDNSTLNNTITQNKKTNNQQRKKELEMFKISNSYFPDDFQLMDAEGVNVSIRKLTKSGLKIVFRFTELNCESCIDSLIPKVRNLSNKIGSENVICIISYSSPNATKILKERYNMKNEFYFVDSQTLKQTYVEHLNNPYFFILWNNRTKFIYMPDQITPVKTDDYLSLVAEIYDSTIKRSSDIDK